MPMYLVHGFRWPRRAIRIHIIMNNIEEARAEYLVTPDSQSAMLKSFKELYPEQMKALQKLRFVEQYDPLDTSSKSVSQPHAFVVDRVKNFDLSFNVQEGINEADATMSEKQLAALEKIKQELGVEEQIGWWVVYNGDEKRMDGVDPESKQLKSKKSFKNLFKKSS